MVPAPEFVQGIAQFNQQQFYACHDTLEEIWHEAPTSDRNFYQGILQIAVGCYHLTQGNRNGASILLGEGLRRLSQYERDFGGIQLEKLEADSEALLVWIQNATASQYQLLTAEPGQFEYWPHISLQENAAD
ncbi:MAG: DUF309 domain-containing protein [Cyanobacteria bacterium P01_H01_bin.15]